MADPVQSAAKAARLAAALRANLARRKTARRGDEDADADAAKDPTSVIPAKGEPILSSLKRWLPVFAGMTSRVG